MRGNKAVRFAQMRLCSHKEVRAWLLKTIAVEDKQHAWLPGFQPKETGHVARAENRVSGL